MVSDEAKRTIDALSNDELKLEINKRNRSRFQGDNYAYLETRLSIVEQGKQAEHRQQDIAYKEEELTLAKEANQISHKANRLSKIAISISITAALIALAALLKDIWTAG
jgi:hypothetical protein